MIKHVKNNKIKVTATTATLTLTIALCTMLSMENITQRIYSYITNPNNGLLNNRKELSFSRISSMKRCPYQHNLRYEDNLIYEKENHYLWFGKSIHATLAYFYLNDMNPTLSQFLNYGQGEFDAQFEIAEKGIEFKEGDTRETITEYGLYMLEEYYKEYAKHDKSTYKVIETEVPFWIPLISQNGRINQKYVLSGIIDLIVQDKSTLKFEIWDHKTLSRKMAEGTEDNSDQMSQYVLGASNFNILDATGVFNVLYKTKKVKFERIPTQRTQKQLEEFIEDVGQVAHAISRKIKYKSHGFNCYSCDFKNLCLNKDKSNIKTCQRKTLSERFADDG